MTTAVPSTALATIQPAFSGPSCLPPTVRRDRNHPLRANKTSDPAANCGQNTYERSHPAVDLTTSPR